MENFQTKDHISPNLCLMPWVHLHIDSQGLVKACCNANITFGNVNTQPLDEIWNGAAISRFRQQTKSGMEDKRCLVCFKKEKSGKQSIRTETLSRFSDYLSRVNESGKARSPVYLDIRYSNICNLRCRTCWHGASSSWFEEARIMNTHFQDKAIMEATPDNVSLVKSVLDWCTDLKEIYFAGGEPLLMVEHYQLLSELIAEGRTDIHLRYNTNLSFLKLKENDVCEIWRHFSKVTLSVSVDGLGQKAEYIRKGLDWERFVANFRTVKEKCPHIQLEIAPTVSVFNILELGQIHRYFVDEGLVGIDDVYINVLHRPNYFNIQILPENLKSIAEERIKSHIDWLMDLNASNSVIREFRSVVDYMNNADWKHQIPVFRKQTLLLDSMRKEDFCLVFPELVPLMGNFEKCRSAMNRSSDTNTLNE